MRGEVRQWRSFWSAGSSSRLRNWRTGRMERSQGTSESRSRNYACSSGRRQGPLASLAPKLTRLRILSSHNSSWMRMTMASIRSGASWRSSLIGYRNFPIQIPSEWRSRRRKHLLTIVIWVRTSSAWKIGLGRMTSIRKWLGIPNSDWRAHQIHPHPSRFRASTWTSIMRNDRSIIHRARSVSTQTFLITHPLCSIGAHSRTLRLLLWRRRDSLRARGNPSWKSWNSLMMTHPF